MAPSIGGDGPPALTETAMETDAQSPITATFGVLGPSIMFAALPMRRHMEVLRHDH